MLGYTVGAVTFYVLHGNTSVLAIIMIDIVHAGGCHTDIAKLFRLPEIICSQHDLIDQHSIDTLNTLTHVFHLSLMIKGNIGIKAVERACIEARQIHSFGIKKDNFFNHYSATYMTSTMDSRAALMLTGIGIALSDFRSTNTCTNWPCATLRLLSPA